MEYTTSSLSHPAVAETLREVHGKAQKDYRYFLQILPKALLGLVRGKKLMTAVTPAMLKQAYIPVSKEQGLFLYNMARASHAKTIVEFGSSFGISTLYLAAAAQDNHGKLVTTEIVPEKCRATEDNLHKAGLAHVATVREGDAMETLRDFPEPVDLLFLDGWKDLYNDLLTLLLPNLRPGAVIIADNVNLADAKAYLRRVQHPDGPFLTTTLNKSTAFSVYMP